MLFEFSGCWSYSSATLCALLFGESTLELSELVLSRVNVLLALLDLFSQLLVVFNCFSIISLLSELFLM